MTHRAVGSWTCEVVVPIGLFSTNVISGHTRFEPRPGRTWAVWCFSWFSLDSPANCRMIHRPGDECFLWSWFDTFHFTIDAMHFSLTTLLLPPGVNPIAVSKIYIIHHWRKVLPPPPPTLARPRDANWDASSRSWALPPIPYDKVLMHEGCLCLDFHTRPLILCSVVTVNTVMGWPA
jgi:hypothetical protein